MKWNESQEKRLGQLLNRKLLVAWGQASLASSSVRQVQTLSREEWVITSISGNFRVQGDLQSQPLRSICADVSVLFFGTQVFFCCYCFVFVFQPGLWLEHDWFVWDEHLIIWRLLLSRPESVPLMYLLFYWRRKGHLYKLSTRSSGSSTLPLIACQQPSIPLSLCRASIQISNNWPTSLTYLSDARIRVRARAFPSWRQSPGHYWWNLLYLGYHLVETLGKLCIKEKSRRTILTFQLQMIQ